MVMPSTFHMRKYYALKSQSHDPDTPTYTDALSGKNSEEYFQAMDDKIQSLIRKDTWDIVSRKPVANHNVIPGIWSLKCKRKPDLENQEIQGTILCKRGYPEETIS